MNIEHRPEGDLGSFVAVNDGKEVGELAYRLNGKNELSIDHTEVEPEFEGKGLGKRLVAEAVEYAKKEQLKVRPLCTYAKLLFERNEEWAKLMI